jgi:nitroreductase
LADKNNVASVHEAILADKLFESRHEMIKELIARSRSYRRYDETFHIERQTLRDLVDLARLCPSGSNLQPLKYILSCDPQRNTRIFSTLAWAGYLKDWPGPAHGKRPTAYIIILLDTTIRTQPGCDHGIAAQSIMLGAAEKGFGGCIIASIQKERLRKALNIPRRYEILLALALGKPAEKVAIEDVNDNDIKYYRDIEDVHRVPKRSLDEIIIG